MHPNDSELELSEPLDAELCQTSIEKVLDLQDLVPMVVDWLDEEITGWGAIPWKAAKHRILGAMEEWADEFARIDPHDFDDQLDELIAGLVWFRSFDARALLINGDVLYRGEPTANGPGVIAGATIRRSLVPGWSSEEREIDAGTEADAEPWT